MGRTVVVIDLLGEEAEDVPARSVEDLKELCERRYNWTEPELLEMTFEEPAKARAGLRNYRGRRR